MSKVNYTKRQYLADIAVNEAAIAVVQATLSGFADALDNGTSIEALSEAWNAAHDREYELEQDRQDIERRWNRRHWTATDYAARELVADNID
mgnify:CR=1 FL=1